MADASSKESARASSLLEFLHICENLKTTKRTGWIRSNIPAPESIGDHMHRMGIMAMLIEDPSVDKNRAIKMAIVHDLAEAIAGDITPYDGVSKEDKFQLEKDGMDRLCGLVGNDSIANEIRGLWLEYEDASTPTARLVKDLDKLEMLVQALEYEKRTGTKLESFYQSTWDVFEHPETKAIAAQVYRERLERLGWHTAKQPAHK
ncbi:hypothetical protein RI367_006157 [Sorochytrium milnesiophthora]